MIKFFIKDVILGYSGVGFITEKRFVNSFAGKDSQSKLEKIYNLSSGKASKHCYCAKNYTVYYTL